MSERGDIASARWGLVGVPFTTCDFCRGRLMKGEMAVGISVYDSPSDYRPWEGEILSDLDSDPLDQGEKGGPEEGGTRGRPTGWDELEGASPAPQTLLGR